MLRTKKIGITVLLFACGLSAMSQQLLTLEQTLEMAYKNSPDIILQKLSLEQSQENLKAQRASLKSRFAFSVSPVTYSKKTFYNSNLEIPEWVTNKNLSNSAAFSISQPILTTGGTVSLSDNIAFDRNQRNNDPIDNSYSNNLQLNINQPIFTHNKIKMDLEALELNLENTMMSYSIQKLNTERSVTQIFYNVYSQQQSLDIAKEELKNQQKSFNIIKNKVEAGLSAKEELWQAELNLANAESSVYNAEVSLENAKDNMKQTIGMPLGNDFNILSNVEVTTIDVKLEDAIAYALKQRMELRQRQIEIHEAEFSIIQTKDENKFQGKVEVSVGLLGHNNKFSKIYQAESIEDNENISLSFDIPIWDWGKRKADIRSSEISKRKAEINLEQERINIEINIRQIYRNLTNLVNQIEIAKKSAINAQRTYELKVEEYENGDLTSMDLSLYQNQLSSSKNDLTGALINYKIELLNLKIQTLWDFEKRVSILPKNIYSVN